MMSDWEFAEQNAEDYEEWRQEVSIGNTLLGLEDWMNEKYALGQTKPRIIHLGDMTPGERSRAACGVSYMHPGNTFTKQTDEVTCLRCRGTRRFYGQTS